MNVIKLVYDKYENDYGFTEGDMDDINDHIHEKIEQIGDKKIDNERELFIYTWGLKKHLPVECDIIFDASLFSARINADVKTLTGKNEIVQQGIINHPKFDIIIEMIVTEIETNDYQKIGIICNYGKHRSVGFAELLKKFYYPKSVINHKGI
jgi:RNase adaptor protein for sRNA GlmZ degradation